MKKYLPILLIAFFGLFVISCDNRDEVVIPQDNDTYSRVLDISNINFTQDNSVSRYAYFGNLPNYFLNSDALLIYRQIGNSNSNPVWQLLPTTDFLAQGELNYYFDYTVNDYKITADADFDLSVQNPSFNNQYLNGQRFRVLLIPASFKTTVDLKDYDAVIKAYGIDDSNPSKL